MTAIIVFFLFFGADFTEQLPESEQAGGAPAASDRGACLPVNSKSRRAAEGGEQLMFALAEPFFSQLGLYHYSVSFDCTAPVKVGIKSAAISVSPTKKEMKSLTNFTRGIASRRRAIVHQF